MKISLILLLKNFFLINLLLLFPLLIFGIIFSFVKKQNNRYLRESIGHFGTLFFGIIGVPVHELSHLLMCLIFKHTVTEVRLFRPLKSRQDTILGYVKHKYNKNSIYQVTGCFFIGIAPMVFGAFLIVFIMNLIYPSLLSTMVSFPGIDDLQMNKMLNVFLYNGRVIVMTIFSHSSLMNISCWIGIYFIVSIALHMTISKADFVNAMNGFLLLESIVLLFSFINIFPGSNAAGIIKTVEQISSILLTVLFISAIFLSIVYLFSYILYRIFNEFLM